MKVELWTWEVRNEWGTGKHRTRWKLSEADAKATFGERLVRAMPGTLEERTKLAPDEIPPGLHSDVPRTK